MSDEWLSYLETNVLLSIPLYRTIDLSCQRLYWHIPLVSGTRWMLTTYQ